MNCLLMHAGWVDQSLCRHVINPDILPSAVTYPGLHLYCLFKGYIKTDLEEKSILIVFWKCF